MTIATFSQSCHWASIRKSWFPSFHSLCTHHLDHNYHYWEHTCAFFTISSSNFTLSPHTLLKDLLNISKMTFRSNLIWNKRRSHLKQDIIYLVCMYYCMILQLIGLYMYGPSNMPRSQWICRISNKLHLHSFYKANVIFVYF